MEAYVVWAVVGVLLIGIELATGTLYLLFLGAAALAAAVAAYVGVAFGIQVLVAAIVAIASLFWVQQHKRTRVQPSMPSIDVGQPVSFEEWIDAGTRRARVRYRGTVWDANVAGDAAAGDSLFITSVDGNTLNVTKQAPARA